MWAEGDAERGHTGIFSHCHTGAPHQYPFGNDALLFSGCWIRSSMTDIGGEVG